MGGNSSAAFSLKAGGTKKKLAKRNAEEVSPSAEGDEGCAPSTAPPFEKGGRKLLWDLRKPSVVSRFFFEAGGTKKKLAKRNAKGFRPLRRARRLAQPPLRHLLKKVDENFCGEFCLVINNRRLRSFRDFSGLLPRPGGGGSRRRGRGCRQRRLPVPSGSYGRSTCGRRGGRSYPSPPTYPRR